MDEEHRLLADSTRRFFADELPPQRWRNKVWWTELFGPRQDRPGLLAASVPERWGGAGGTYDHDAVTLLEQARGRQ
ncbi:MAG: hypothetical protein GKR94_15525 [Gammaproteobacteria bacterium]|nr:hypothetical protein [Gammaproteobacteria bacterium]